MGIFYLDFLFSPSGFFWMSSFWKPTCLDSTHFSMDFLISKRCTLVLFDVQAIMLRVGWKMIEVIRALPEPRRSS